MTHPDGGFYSAQDADSLVSPDAKEKKEGAFYVWEKKEILDVLGKDEGERFCAAYGVEEEGGKRPPRRHPGAGARFWIRPAGRSSTRGPEARESALWTTKLSAAGMGS